MNDEDDGKPIPMTFVPNCMSNPSTVSCSMGLRMTPLRRNVRVSIRYSCTIARYSGGDVRIVEQDMQLLLSPASHASLRSATLRASGQPGWMYVPQELFRGMPHAPQICEVNLQPVRLLPGRLPQFLDRSFALLLVARRYVYFGVVLQQSLHERVIHQCALRIKRQ